MKKLNARIMALNSIPQEKVILLLDIGSNYKLNF